MGNFGDDRDPQGYGALVRRWSGATALLGWRTLHNLSLKYAELFLLEKQQAADPPRAPEAQV